jgi:GTP-binding protein EngB required for normal cell division
MTVQALQKLIGNLEDLQRQQVKMINNLEGISKPIERAAETISNQMTTLARETMTKYAQVFDKMVKESQSKSIAMLEIVEKQAARQIEIQNQVNQTVITSSQELKNAISALDYRLDKIARTRWSEYAMIVTMAIVAAGIFLLYLFK